MAEEEHVIYTTKTGKVLTDADIQALADEAERGYDVSHLAPAPPRRFGPTQADHWLVTDDVRCAACQKRFEPGGYTTLIAMGPADDPEAREKAREGRAYNAVALPVHWACATGKEEE